jgi:hypothetical protein
MTTQPESEERTMNTFPITAAAAEWTIVLHHIHPNGHALVVEHTTALYTGRGEFYSGLRNGDEVSVSRSTYFRPDGTVSHESYAARSVGAWLAVAAADLRFLN